VLSVNDAPVGLSTTGQCEEVGCATTIVSEDNQLVIDPRDFVTDVDSTLDFDSFSVSVVDGPDFGIVVVSGDGRMTYTPDATFYSAVDVWKYTVTDP